jgi:hypothetical protein
VRRRLLLSALLLGAGAAAATAVLGVQARAVRADLTAAERLADQVADAAREGKASDLGPLQQRTREAHDTTDGLLWRAGAVLPVVGQDVRAVRRVARAAADLSDRAAPSLVEAVRLVDGGGLLRDGRVDLNRLGTVQGHVAQAQRVTAAVRRDLGRTEGHASVRREAQRLQDKVVDLDDALTTGSRTLTQAPAMLGAGGSRRYLVAVQNNAEARATGGLVGIVALVTADRGRLELVRTVTNDALRSARTPVPSDPAAARTWTGIGSTVAWFDANLTPHAPDAARNLAGLWQAQRGERVDGVVLLDAVVLQHLLVRPVTLGTTTLRPGEVVDWVARREYLEHPDVQARKALLRELAEELFDQVTALRSTQPLLDAARSGHLFVWSARAAEQALLADHDLGGALPAGGSPYLQVVTQNFGGNKLDYYLRRRVQVRRDGDAYAVTVTLTNTAPKGLPDYVAGRADHRGVRRYDGQARIGLSLYASAGARFERWVADRRALLVRFDTDHGLTLGTTILELPRGASVTVTTRVRMADGELTYRQQPLVRPDDLDLQVPHRVVGR